MEQVKAFVTKHMKVVIGVVVIIIAGYGALKFIQSRPIAVIDYVEPQFEGYDGIGNATYNKSSALQKIQYQLLLHDHINKTVASDVSAGRAASAYRDNVALMNKIQDVQQQVSSVKIAFDHQAHLHNGDKITLKVSAPADVPIKSATKQLTVSGLKKAQSYTVKDAMGKSAPKFDGINRSGQLSISKTIDDRFNEARKADQGEFKNGDVVTYKLRSAYIEAQEAKGKRLVGPRTVTYKVSGLKDLQDVTDWAALSKQIQTFAQSRNQSGSVFTYKLEPLDSYAYVEDRDNTHDRVHLPDNVADLPDTTEFVSFATIIKITETNSFWPEDGPKITYVPFGMVDIPYYNGKLHTVNVGHLLIESMTSHSHEDAIAGIKADQPSTQKINIK